MEGFWVIVLISSLVWATIWGVVTYMVAVNRGYYGCGPFFLGFFLEVLGLIIILTRPNLRSNTSYTATNAMRVRCRKCGAELSDDQDFCPQCGNRRIRKLVCDECNAELREGQPFCHKCGKKVEGSFASGAVAQRGVNHNNLVGKKKRESKTKYIVGIIVGIVGLAFFIILCIFGFFVK